LQPDHCKVFDIGQFSYSGAGFLSLQFILILFKVFYSLEGFVLVSKSADLPNHSPKMEKGCDFFLKKSF